MTGVGFGIEVEEFLRWAAAQRSVPRGGFVGCSEAQLEEIRLAQRVARLPADYESFLRSVGVQCGGLFAGSSITYPWLTTAKADLIEEGDPSAAKRWYGPNAFVIWGHQGYIYSWFDDVSRETPRIMRQSDDNEPVEAASSFAEWLDLTIDEHVALYGDRQIASGRVTATPVSPMMPEHWRAKLPAVRPGEIEPPCLITADDNYLYVEAEATAGEPGWKMQEGWGTIIDVVVSVVGGETKLAVVDHAEGVEAHIDNSVHEVEQRLRPFRPLFGRLPR